MQPPTVDEGSQVPVQAALVQQSVQLEHSFVSLAAKRSCKCQNESCKHLCMCKADSVTCTMSHVYAPLAMTGLKVELWKLTRMQLQVASLDCRQHHQTVLKGKFLGMRSLTCSLLCNLTP